MWDYKCEENYQSSYHRGSPGDPSLVANGVTIAKLSDNNYDWRTPKIKYLTLNGNVHSSGCRTPHQIVCVWWEMVHPTWKLTLGRHSSFWKYQITRPSLLQGKVKAFSHMYTCMLLHYKSAKWVQRLSVLGDKIFGSIFHLTCLLRFCSLHLLGHQKMSLKAFLLH